MSKFGKWFKQKREKLQQWKKDNPKTAKALGQFGDSMQQSAQDIAGSIDTSVSAKGHIVAPLVDENDLRKVVTTEVEDLLATKQELSYEPYADWLNSKDKKDIIT